MDDIVAITLFRHGLTEANKRRAYLGWNDSSLTKEAKQQLSSYTFSQHGYDLFVSSDLQRCLSTMEKLFPGVVPFIFSELREMNFGIFEGKKYEELKDNKAYECWIDNYTTYHPPQGESFEQFTNRVDTGWQKIMELVLNEGLQRPFIVTHGGVIRYLLSKYSQEKREFWDWNIPHGTGILMTFNREQLRRAETCISLQAVPSMANELG